MAKTANVFARVEPEVKMQAENVLAELGIPMSNAINLYLRQIVLRRGIPFETKLPALKPVALGALSEEEVDAMLEEAVAQIKAGRVRPMEEVHADFQRKYGI
ncbi:MAG: type II toxin-antitoxin system RelB/DinJ family antitoxin [Coriobacteriia bacterium]|nr:type II toxin-antitoxin system RelB/DinJ family antitoxin [Coriobacteriia bacterium]